MEFLKVKGFLSCFKLAALFVSLILTPSTFSTTQCPSYQGTQLVPENIDYEYCLNPASII